MTCKCVDNKKLMKEKIVPLCKKLYERHLAGCCLHIVLDDCNYYKYWLPDILKTAKDNGHEDCIAITELLMKLSDYEIAEVYDMLWETGPYSSE